MLDGLVTVGIVAHIHNLHLAYLMNHSTIIALIKYWWYAENRVEHRREIVFSAHKGHQSCRVVEY